MNDTERISLERGQIILRQRVLSRMPQAGDFPTAIGGLTMYRRDEASKIENCFYKPIILKIVQGRKRVLVGKDEFAYGEDDLLIAGLDMPAASGIVDASAERPCLSMVVDLDQNLIAQLALEVPPATIEPKASVLGLVVQRTEPEIQDAFLRLEELLDKPQQIPILAPMIIREIHYRVLTGPSGSLLRSFHTIGSQSNQVARAITWLRVNFKESVQVEDLAEKVNMAPSTFHRRFKEVTTLSPLQYQKSLRLHEAKRLMLVSHLDAGRACEAVGYESLTQFNREYKRFFGEPPRRNVVRLRKESALPLSP